MLVLLDNYAAFNVSRTKASYRSCYVTVLLAWDDDKILAPRYCIMNKMSDGQYETQDLDGYFYIHTRPTDSSSHRRLRPVTKL